jgi:hypothetical protein
MMSLEARELERTINVLEAISSNALPITSVVGLAGFAIAGPIAGIVAGATGIAATTVVRTYLKDKGATLEQDLKKLHTSGDITDAEYMKLIASLNRITKDGPSNQGTTP